MNAYIELTRPKQWLKSAFVIAPLVFSMKFFQVQNIIESFLAAAVFILAGGAVYIFNDILDVEEDKKHPQKKKRQ